MSAGIGTQITPLEWRIVKAISSGVALRRGEDDVALVLAVLVVDDDDRLARGDVGDRLLDVVEADSTAFETVFGVLSVIASPSSRRTSRSRRPRG